MFKGVSASHSLLSITHFLPISIVGLVVLQIGQLRAPATSRLRQRRDLDGSASILLAGMVMAFFPLPIFTSSMKRPTLVMGFLTS